MSTTGFVQRVTPRGRHAPPLEVRRALQRRRLLDAGAILLEDLDVTGVQRMTAEQVSRAAGMSKATFYEHYADVGEFALDLCTDLRQLAATPGRLHTVQHAAVMCNLLIPHTFAFQLAERLQQLGWTPPTIRNETA